MSKETNPKLRVLNEAFGKEIKKAEDNMRNDQAALRNLAEDYKRALKKLVKNEDYKSGDFDKVAQDDAFKIFCANLGIAEKQFLEGESNNEVKKAVELFNAKTELMGDKPTDTSADKGNAKRANDILRSYESLFIAVNEQLNASQEKIALLQEVQANKDFQGYLTSQPLDNSRFIVRGVLDAAVTGTSAAEVVESALHLQATAKALIASSATDTPEDAKEKILAGAEAAVDNALYVGRKALQENARKTIPQIQSEMKSLIAEYRDNKITQNVFEQKMQPLNERLNLQQLVLNQTKDKWYHQLHDAVKDAVLNKFPAFVKEVWNPRDGAKAGIKEYGRRALEWLGNVVKGAVQKVKEAGDIMRIGLENFKANTEGMLDLAVSGICRAGISATSAAMGAFVRGSEQGSVDSTSNTAREAHAKHSELKIAELAQKRAAELSRPGWSGKLAAFEQKRSNLQSRAHALGEKMFAAGATVLDAPGQLLARAREASKEKGFMAKASKFLKRE